AKEFEIEDEITIDNNSCAVEESVDDGKPTFMNDTYYVSSDDEDDDDMSSYETRLSKTSNVVEVVIKTEKRSLVSGLYVEVPPRKKIRSAYKSKEFEEEISYTEEECLSELLSCENISEISDDDYIKYDLKNFIIYDYSEKEIAEITIEKENKTIYWDGIIVDNNKELFCKEAVYTTFSISGYGQKIPDIEVLIQSNLDKNVWYNLVEPHPMYQRLWISFIWKARMVKYVLDYLHENPNSLFHDLKQNFYDWISKYRSTNPVFKEWISAVKGNFDFRSVVANNIELLWNQAHNLGKGYSNLKFFGVIQSDQEYQQYKIIDHSEKVQHFECCISEEEQLYEKVTIDGVTFNVGDAVEVYPDEPSKSDRWLCEYEVGDCILVNPQSGDTTDFYTVCCIESVDSENEIVKLRRFYRFCESVARACHIEFLEFGKPLPVNLLHKGSGNHFFFSRKYDRETKSIRPIKSNKSSLSAKFPDYKYKVGHIGRLNGLDLFCGGGSLGRGFEDAGVVKCKWAIDKDSAALKTYRHNAQGDDITIINESVNKILSAAILGTNDVRVPEKVNLDQRLLGLSLNPYILVNIDYRNLT
ncbi:3494_t:CDS:10, partial [Acaulospora colombiana]